MNVANSSLGLSQIPKPAMLFRVRGDAARFDGVGEELESVAE